MARVTCEGMLWIEMADFWAWASSLGIEVDEGPLKARFSIEDDAIVIESRESREFIDAVDFWSWINAEHLPRSFHHGETLYGVPDFEASPMLRVAFASGDDNPAGWVTPPEFLKAWKK